MSDYIDRQAAIDALNGEIIVTGKANAEAVREYINLVEDRIKRLPSAERWVPCSERLPEATRESYWVCTDIGSQHECRWTNSSPIWTNLTTEWHWNIFDLPQYTKVVAWMPLPEPYEEHSMEEFMQGQDPGDPEDGRL